MTESSRLSMTQQFNTTTSMGRLTLNMLLSFAQLGPLRAYSSLNWYSRRSTVPGLRRRKQELVARLLTPLILVRIHVPQPGSWPQIAAYL